MRDGSCSSTSDGRGDHATRHAEELRHAAKQIAALDGLGESDVTASCGRRKPRTIELGTRDREIGDDGSTLRRGDTQQRRGLFRLHAHDVEDEEPGLLQRVIELIR